MTRLFSAFGESKAQAPKRWLVAFSFLLAALFLWLALRNLDWGVFFATLRNVRYGYLPLIFLWSSATFFVRAWRLRVLLGAELPLLNVFWANMAGYLGNNLLPARAGELVRAAYLGKRNPISASYALAAGLVERLMDMLALVILGAAALALNGVLSPTFQNALKSVSVLGGVGLLILFTLPRFEAPLTNWLVKIPVNDSLKEKALGFFRQFNSGLRALNHAPRVAQFILLTALIWFLDASANVFMAYILHLHWTLSQSFVLLAALGLSSAIPSTPGYVGVYQFAAVTALAPFGVSQADALAFIVISQIFGYLIVGAWGALALWRFNKDA
ncbi:MAG: flippase-like domain-containing protein [Anaerolineales bacterium]|nr:flippase-like domain-containing protein [Anaerolineales bacterium]